MKTLSKNITSSFFAQAEGRGILTARWSAAVRSGDKHTLRAEHHLLYAILRGKDWRKGFTAPTSSKKVENGALYGYSSFLRVAIHNLSHAAAHPVFVGLLTPDLPKIVQSMLPYIPYGVTNEEFKQLDSYVVIPASDSTEKVLVAA